MQSAGEVQVIGSVLFVSYQGKITFGDEIDTLSKQVRECYPGVRDVVLNMHDVELGPSDIPQLLIQYLTAYAAGYRIRLCSASPAVRTVLESTRVLEVFQLPLDESKEESVAAFDCRYAAPQRMIPMASS